MEAHHELYVINSIIVYIQILIIYQANYEANNVNSLTSVFFLLILHDLC